MSAAVTNRWRIRAAADRLQGMEGFRSLFYNWREGKDRESYSRRMKGILKNDGSWYGCGICMAPAPLLKRFPRVMVFVPDELLGRPEYFPHDGSRSKLCHVCWPVAYWLYQAGYQNDHAGIYFIEKVLVAVFDEQAMEVARDQRALKTGGRCANPVFMQSSDDRPPPRQVGRAGRKRRDSEQSQGGQEEGQQRSRKRRSSEQSEAGEEGRRSRKRRDSEQSEAGQEGRRPRKRRDSEQSEGGREGLRSRKRRNSEQSEAGQEEGKRLRKRRDSEQSEAGREGLRSRKRTSSFSEGKAAKKTQVKIKFNFPRRARSTC